MSTEIAADAVIILRNRTSLERIGTEYLPIIRSTVGFCRNLLGDEVLEIRVLGSVARGDAVAGRSDVDLALLTAQPVPATTKAASELARLWNVTVEWIAPGHAAAVREAPAERLERLSRTTGKDLLRCWRTRLIRELGVFDQSMPDLCRRLHSCWPEHGELFDELWRLYTHPTRDRERVLTVLRHAVATDRRCAP